MPVLRDEPDAGEGGERRREVVVDAAERGTRREREENRAAEVPFVQSDSGQVETRTERVPLDADEARAGHLLLRPGCIWTSSA